MKALLLLLYVWTPLRQETSLEVFVTCRTPEIFSDYRNYNFKQEIRPGRRRPERQDQEPHPQPAEPEPSRSRRRALPRGPGPGRPAGFRPGAAAGPVASRTICETSPLFLKNRIEYTEAELPQEAEAVLAQRKAHCIGFANVAQALLACVGIASRPVNGFYLREADGRVEPVPHRWLEIDLPGERRVFYDPQYQDFSSRYLVTNLGFPLDRIERFAGVVVRKNKKILDE